MVDRWWEQEKWTAGLAPYAILMRAFLENRLTGPEFELLYLDLFKSDGQIRPKEIFDVLDGLFADVDDYCPDEDLRKQVGGLDDAQLRERVRSAEERLEMTGRK